MSRRPLRASALLLTTMLLTGLLASPARADVPGPITDRVIDIIDDAGGVVGMHVKEVGGQVIAAHNESFAFEPASTIKVLPHLYAHVQVQAGNATLGDKVNRYLPLGCPEGSPVVGADDLGKSLGKMMWVSDNPATKAQTDHWGFQTLTDYAASLGANETLLENTLGCLAPGSQTVDDNTTSLTDLGIMYEGVADGSLISGPVRQSFYSLMSGREQFEEFGADFTGVWEKLLVMVEQEAPAGMSVAARNAFRDAMTANHKGGAYIRCLDVDCSTVQTWFSFAGWAEFPTCVDAAVGSSSYVWGIFIHGSIDDEADFSDPTYLPPAAFLLGAGAAEPLREQMNAALADWEGCV